MNEKHIVQIAGELKISLQQAAAAAMLLDEGATISREKGLDPLAKLLFEQAASTQPETEAAAFVNAETEAFVRSLKLPASIAIVLVNESGSSIYFASEVAREEFHDQDITVRGSVSIGRRLMDPLAELVKLDPKSIGVGQYQHDVDQGCLKQSLDDVVMACTFQSGSCGSGCKEKQPVGPVLQAAPRPRRSRE